MITLKLKKILLYFITGIVLILGATTYYAGSYFVDFAFKRGTATDSLALPAASKHIITPNLAVPAKPHFKNEVLQLNFKDGKRTATAFYPHQATDKWIIMVHGYCRDQRYVWNYAEHYLQKGYNVLTPDLNASGNSEGTYLTMGVKESEDIQGWINKLITLYPQSRIALHGVSMGAATVMLTASKSLPPQVYAVVEDCGYTSASKMCAGKLKELYGLPPFPVMDAVNLVQALRTGVYLSEATPGKFISNCKLPILFIHGDKDRLVPVSMLEELYSNCASSFKEKYIVEGAGHASAMETNPQAYFEKVLSFLNAYETK